MSVQHLCARYVLNFARKFACVLDIIAKRDATVTVASTACCYPYSFATELAVKAARRAVSARSSRPFAAACRIGHHMARHCFALMCARKSASIVRSWCVRVRIRLVALATLEERCFAMRLFLVNPSLILQIYFFRCETLIASRVGTLPHIEVVQLLPASGPLRLAL